MPSFAKTFVVAQGCLGGRSSPRSGEHATPGQTPLPAPASKLTESEDDRIERELSDICCVKHEEKWGSAVVPLSSAASQSASAASSVVVSDPSTSPSA